MNDELSDALLHFEMRKLQSLGDPFTFRYLRAEPLVGHRGIAFERSKKLAGIDFETVAPAR